MAPLKPPAEWARERGIRILDPDGWRLPDPKSFDEPVTEEEFDRRLPTCTIDHRPR